MVRLSIASTGLALALAVGAPTGAAASTTTSGASGIPNLSDVKARVVRYYTSGAYEREAAARIALARAYVDRRVAAHAARPALVLDVDDTALSDYAYEKRHDFGYDDATYDADVRAERFTAIAPTLALTRHAAAQGVAVFFITGRRTDKRAVTLGNLAKVGFPRPAGLYLRPPSDRARSVIPFKSGARRRIVAAGYTILANVGDQWSDLGGGYAEQIFKLPNPMYAIP